MDTNALIGVITDPSTLAGIAGVAVTATFIMSVIKVFLPEDPRVRVLVSLAVSVILGILALGAAGVLGAGFQTVALILLGIFGATQFIYKMLPDSFDRNIETAVNNIVD
jgi:predicted branched-subunit amino acid permease